MKNPFLFIVILGFALLLPFPARADVAPPEQPPGTNPVPGKDDTQVRMMAETVTMSVLKQSDNPKFGEAKVDAVFTMRNLGNADEKMLVRFPLSFWNGIPSGFDFPDIEDLMVKVNGVKVASKRVTTPNDSGTVTTPIPWAAFNVSFSAGQDVKIEVSYIGGGATDNLLVTFRYILQTGAGWKDTIGSVDFIVKLPYDANDINVILYKDTYYGSTAGATVSGRQLRWHFDNLEPSYENDFNVTMILPQAWLKVLNEQDNLKANPNDGEAWGRLGMAYKDINLEHGRPRQDTGGLKAYRLAVMAYQKAVTLKPKDSMWHAGFGRLLFEHAAFSQFVPTGMDYSTLSEAVTELKTAVELDQHNQLAHNLLAEIAEIFPEALQKDASGYTYLILTATPIVTPWQTDTPIVVSSATLVPSKPSSTYHPKITAVPSSTPAPVQDTAIAQVFDTTVPDESPTPVKPTSGLKLPCAGSLVLLPIVGLLIITKKRKMSGIG